MIRAASFLALCLLATSARASSDDEARARFAAGVRAWDAKDFEAALREFRAADAAKPSAATKRNVGLALKALGRDAEGIEALEAMLAMPGVAEEVRVKTLRAIDEMLAHVGVVRVHVTARGAPIDGAWSLRVDDGAAVERPVRVIVAPGAHTIAVRADAGEGTRAIAIAAGDDREVTIDVAPDPVRAPVPTASFDSSAPAATVGPLPPMPPPYVADASRDAAREPARRFEPAWYARAGIGLAGEARVLSTAMDESGTSRDFGGASIAARVGREMGPWWSVELLGEVGAMTPTTYGSPNAPSVDANVRLVRESIVPMLRLHTAGAWRLVGATGLGVTLEQIRATLAEPQGAIATRTGQAAGIAWMAELGGEVDLGKAMLEMAAFVEVHGVGPARDADGDRFFGESVATRGGVRLLVGWRL